jgi:hypothetical protein
MRPHIRQADVPATTRIDVPCSPDDQRQARAKANRRAIRSSTAEIARASEVTLDDFGGRSDALGG